MSITTFRKAFETFKAQAEKKIKETKSVAFETIVGSELMEIQHSIGVLEKHMKEKLNGKIKKI